MSNKLSILFFLSMWIGMILLTLVCGSEMGSSLFVHESAEYLTVISRANIVFSIFLLLIYLSIVFYYWKRPTILKACLLGLVFVLWFLCGRTLGFKNFPDGRINTGWYCIETSRFNVCDHKIDCETVIYYQTSVEEMPFWCVKIKNRSLDRVIFVGPFIWTKTLSLYKNTFDTGEYN